MTRIASPWIHTNFMYRLLGYEKLQRQYVKELHALSLSTIKKRREEYREEKKNKTLENPKEEILGGLTVSFHGLIFD